MSDLQNGEVRLYSQRSSSSLTMTIHDYENEFRFVIKDETSGLNALTCVCSLRYADAKLLYQALGQCFGRGSSQLMASPETLGIRKWAIDCFMNHASTDGAGFTPQDLERWATRFVAFVQTGEFPRECP